jgi:hypothetical protein
MPVQFQAFPEAAMKPRIYCLLVSYLNGCELLLIEKAVEERSRHLFKVIVNAFAWR